MERLDVKPLPLDPTELRDATIRAIKVRLPNMDDVRSLISKTKIGEGVLDDPSIADAALRSLQEGVIVRL